MRVARGAIAALTLTVVACLGQSAALAQSGRLHPESSRDVPLVGEIRYGAILLRERIHGKLESFNYHWSVEVSVTSGNGVYGDADVQFVAKGSGNAADAPRVAVAHVRLYDQHGSLVGLGSACRAPTKIKVTKTPPAPQSRCAAFSTTGLPGRYTVRADVVTQDSQGLLTKRVIANASQWVETPLQDNPNANEAPPTQENMPVAKLTIATIKS